MRGRWPIGLLIAIAGLALAPARATAQDYYAGKTIDLVVGNYPGGGYDIYARTVARHLGRNIPGNPAIVVKNMPGAGSAKAGAHIGQIAPKDGLSIAAVTPGAITGPLLDDKPESMFDLEIPADMFRAEADASDAYRETGVGHVNDRRVVPGYKGTLDVALAMERAEVDGVCGWEWSSAKSQKSEWIRDGKLNFLLQIGPHANDELTKMGVPTLWQYVKDDDNRRVAELIVGQQAFQRPYFVAMGTPNAYVAILRKAFDDTMRDEQFLADARKIRIDVSPLPGATVQDLVQKFYATPKHIVEQGRRAIRP